MKFTLLLAAILLSFMLFLNAETTYLIVDTGQSTVYDDLNEIPPPSADDPFYGQDAQFNGNQPSYTDNGDGTVTDNVTGFMWQATPDQDGDGDIDVYDKLSFEEAISGAEDLDLAGYDDWRLPTIKESYSLILFSGIDPSGWQGNDPELLTPFIDIEYFDFAYGDTDAGERIIDAQFASSTLYVGTTMNGAETMFGVNFADGRIKGYPTGPMPGQSEDKQFYVLYVRGNTLYGINDLSDNGDGTISDEATGLMWQQNDSETGLNWEEALSWVQDRNQETYLGYNDWRLPNVKELQSIVDYTLSPSTSNSAALDPIFNISSFLNDNEQEDYPYFWSSTTHANMSNGGYAAYVSFGRALGWMEEPPGSGNYTLMDVHGAGAQRSDPKSGNPEDWPYGHGPQGDVISIYNFVRLVRNIDETHSENELILDESSSFLEQNFPNPFDQSKNDRTSQTSINYQLDEPGHIEIVVYNILGQKVKVLANLKQEAGNYSVYWDGTDDSYESVRSGLYFYTLMSDKLMIDAKKVLLLK